MLLSAQHAEVHRVLALREAEVSEKERELDAAGEEVEETARARDEALALNEELRNRVDSLEGSLEDAAAEGRAWKEEAEAAQQVAYVVCIEVAYVVCIEV